MVKHCEKTLWPAGCACTDPAGQNGIHSALIAAPIKYYNAGFQWEMMWQKFNHEVKHIPDVETEPEAEGRSNSRSPETLQVEGCL
ncbi:hypothetical protein EVAR_11263_1 [Eumeta japonica]|uniref:Uncharacterized protein n=1 Tax=Eumeta variegata TaxID=151549 RepID=A0A4C1UKP9_EUMVA|nr:hypothetical protein EVAR_11263_1 [Eumeta japonica]